MKEKIKVIDRDQLKYIAALLMFIGHLLTYTVDELHFWGFPSFVVRILIYSMYVAPPIFMFFISEGFNYTNSKSKYVIRLLITGVITQFAFVLANVGSMDWNMFLYSGNIILTPFSSRGEDDFREAILAESFVNAIREAHIEERVAKEDGRLCYAFHLPINPELKDQVFLLEKYVEHTDIKIYRA